MAIPFYDEYFAFPSFSQDSLDERFKDNYIRSKAVDGNIYKFVAITDCEELNKTKLDMLAKGEFWASYHIYFEDKREIFRKYDIKKVSSKTKWKSDAILNFFSTIDEMNNISCFTYAIADVMWNEYANNSNGFCLEFDILNSDKFFPVVYIDKDKLDMTEDIILSFNSIHAPFANNASKKMSILPWVLKDQKYRRENELRFLCGDEYDDENGIMGGRIAPGKKKMMGIKGIPYSFKYAGLRLKKIYIGCNCSETSSIINICDAQKIMYEIL